MKLLFIALCSVVLLTPSGASASTISGTLSGGVVTAPPYASPGAGTYTIAQSVALTATSSSSIYYTTDGATSPICGSVGTSYAGTISISSSLTLKAVSCYSNGSSSTVASFEYVINIPPDAPTASPATTTPYISAQDITLTDASTTASIYYTSNGDDPYCSASTLFSSGSPIHLNASVTLKAVACTSTGTSTVATFVYVINIPAPAPDPAPASGGNGPVAGGGGISAGGNAVIPTPPPANGGVVLGTTTESAASAPVPPPHASVAVVTQPRASKSQISKPATQKMAATPATSTALAAAAGLAPAAPLSSFGPLIAALILALLLASWAAWFWLKSGTSH